MYLLWQQRQYSVQTGVVEHRASYACDHCEKMLHMMVHARGYGASTANYDFTGGSVQHQNEAARRAQASASGFGNRAMASAPCPHCGRLPGDGERMFAVAANKERLRAKLVLPVPVVAATVVALTQFGPAMQELTYSATLLVMAIALSLAAAFGSLALVLCFPGGVMPAPPARVFFWLPRPDADADASADDDETAKAEPDSFDWYEAPLRTQGRGVSWSGWGTWAALGGMVCAGLVALGMYNAYEHTFAEVVVATKAPAGTRITVQPVGDAVSTFYVSTSSHDLFSAKVKVRKRHASEVHVTIDPLVDQAYVLPKGDDGWVIGPSAAIGELCFAEEVVHYGRNAPPPTLRPLPGSGDVYLVPPHTDHFFEAAPDRIDADRGTERRAVRALPCADLNDKGATPAPH